MYNNLGLIFFDKVFEKEESKVFVVFWWYVVYLCDNFVVNFYVYELFDFLLLEGAFFYIDRFSFLFLYIFNFY